jgi:hypothetical protein
MTASAAHQRVVEGDAKGGLRREFSGYGAAHDGEYVVDRQALVGEQAVVGGPVAEL